MADGSSGGRGGMVRRLGERPVYCGAELQVAEIELQLTAGHLLPWEVVRLPRRASVVLADGDDQVLLVWRYRFVQDRWGWELPGGLVEDREDPSITVARELEELAGCRARELTQVITFQPEPHSMDGEHVIFAGQNPEPIGDAQVGADDVRCEWVASRSVTQLIAGGDIWAAGTLIGLLRAAATHPAGPSG